MKKAPKLTDAERSEIQILTAKGYSARATARVLGRSPNTVSSELQRNSSRDGVYTASTAKQRSYVRRRYARYQGKKLQDNDELRSFVILKLGEHWNPDEVAGYLTSHPQHGFYISKTAIYNWLRSAWGQQYCDLLYSKRYRRKPRKPRTMSRVMIPDRTPLSERPAVALDRDEIGHYEYDSVVSSKHSSSTTALAVLSERRTRLVRACLVSSLKPAPYAQVIASLVSTPPP